MSLFSAAPDGWLKGVSPPVADDSPVRRGMVLGHVPEGHSPLSFSFRRRALRVRHGESSFLCSKPPGKYLVSAEQSPQPGSSTDKNIRLFTLNVMVLYDPLLQMQTYKGTG